MRRRKESLPEPSAASTVTIPVDPVAERVIIAAAASDARLRVELTRRLPVDTFLVDEHRAIWAAIGDLTRRGLAFDLTAIQRLAGERLRIEYLQGILDQPSAPKNLEWHIDTVLWDRQRATAATGPISSLLEALRNPTEAPERVRALARHVGEAFSGGHGTGRFLRNSEELVRSQVEEVRKRVSGHAVFPYGVDGLDVDHDTNRRRMIPAAKPGEVTVVTGVSGGGKSTFVAHIALGLARQGRRVLFGAWEPGSGMTLELLACLSLGWSRTLLFEGALTDKDVEELEARMQYITKWIRFMENPFRRQRGEKYSNDRNLDLVQEHIADSGCDVFIADLWERCLHDTDPNDEKEALFRQQAMADEMKVHCILLAQQRLKDLEQRADKRPTREGIKGSGAWVEVPDTIFGVHRPGQWKSIVDDKLQVFILKQRYGIWPLAVEFDWDGERGSVSGGRTIHYDQPGEQGGLIEGAFIAPGSTEGTKRRRRAA